MPPAFSAAFKTAVHCLHCGFDMRSRPNFKVDMGFGLHHGWAIEGAIGSYAFGSIHSTSDTVEVCRRLFVLWITSSLVAVGWCVFAVFTRLMFHILAHTSTCPRGWRQPQSSLACLCFFPAPSSSCSPPTSSAPGSDARSRIHTPHRTRPHRVHSTRTHSLQHRHTHNTHTHTQTFCFCF